MVRNDMARIAQTGSVAVSGMFRVEKYPTVWQMTSTVQAKTSAGLQELLRGLFPAASITGAPKIRTMQIINSLESTPRQIYTGTIGMYGPGRKAQFNVAIRTLLIDKQSQAAEYGVGGGIVWDSEAGEEWEETRTKARILYEQPKPFDLLETMRWTPAEGWFLLDQHLARLSRSAEYFSYPYDQTKLIERLTGAAANFSAEAQRVRLRLSRDGQITLEAQPLLQGANPTCIALARLPVNTSDRFLYHKTTRRERYQQALAEMPGSPDVLLWNERGEVTESTIANVIVDLDGRRVTPPVDSGLLPGTYRAWLLETQQVVEAVVRLEDLKRCDSIFLANAVRGMWEVKLDCGENTD
jgi:para-aminobenzoate synthetase / 4-amino-4-deoxychorismate lyase